MRNFDEKVEIVTVEDYDLWLRVAFDGNSIKTIDNCLGIYRIHDGNSISQPSVYLRSMVVLLDTRFSIPQNSYIEQRIRYKRESDLYAEVASMDFSSARLVPGLRHTVHAFKLSSRPRKEMLLPVAGVMNLMNSFLFGIAMRIRRKRQKNRWS